MANTPTTALGAAMRAARGDTSGTEIAAKIGLSKQVFYRFERGDAEPAVKAAEKLATWLGWSVGAVIDAARRPAE